MPFKGARLKIKRANKHISDVESGIDRLKKRLVVMAHVEPDTGCEFIKCDFVDAQDADAFDELPAIIGDAVHNLKCASTMRGLKRLLACSLPATGSGLSSRFIPAVMTLKMR